MMESVEIKVAGSDGIYQVECHFGKFHSSRPCRTVGDILEAVVDSMSAYRLHAEPKLSDDILGLKTILGGLSPEAAHRFKVENMEWQIAEEQLAGRDCSRYEKRLAELLANPPRKPNDA